MNSEDRIILKLKWKMYVEGARIGKWRTLYDKDSHRLFVQVKGKGLEDHSILLKTK